MACSPGYIMRSDGTCEFVDYVLGDPNVDGIQDTRVGRGGNFGDWWNRNSDEVKDTADWAYCKIFPKNCQQQQAPVVVMQQQNNTILYVLGGSVLLLFLILIFKK